MSHSLLSEWIEIIFYTFKDLGKVSHSLLSEWIEINGSVTATVSVTSHSLLSEWIEIVSLAILDECLNVSLFIE